MLRRCVWRPSLCPQLHQRRLVASRVAQFQYVVTAESRRAASTSNPAIPQPKPRKWYLFAVVGLFGFTVGSWYRILGFSKNTDSFEPFELIAKEPVSSTASVFTLKTKGNNISTSAWKAGAWNVQFKQPQLQIVRAYTPLPPLPEDLDPATESVQCLRFLIRRDGRGGEMSTYLHRLPVGAEVELRGPNIEYQIGKDCDNVIFIAGGTGIATALQIAHAMFEGVGDHQKKEKKLQILWANRRREDCAGGVTDGATQTIASAASKPSGGWSWSRLLPGSDTEAAEIHASAEPQPEPNAIVKQLNDLKQKHEDNVTVTYFVDEEKSYIHSGTIEQALSARHRDSESSSTEVIVSGPPGFITYLAGPKIWKDGEEQQGPLGGRLAQVLGKDGQPGVKVWKV